MPNSNHSACSHNFPTQAVEYQDISIFGEVEVTTSEVGDATTHPGLVIHRIFAHDELKEIPQQAIEAYREIRKSRDELARFDEAIGLLSGGRPSPETVVEVMRQDVVIRRRIPECSKSPGGKRGKVIKLSRASRQRMMLTARNLPGLEYMLTLTYPAEYPHDGKTVKYHFKCLRQWLQRQGFTYGFWFLEFQLRGAPHYHIFLPHVEGTLTSDWRAKLSRRWAEIVNSTEFEKHVRAGTKYEVLRCKDGAARYASQYAGKMEQKQVPKDYENVGRFWGVWGSPEDKGGSKPVMVVKQVSGVTFHMVDLVRFTRRAYVASRRKWSNPRKRKWKDRGRRGFIAWGVGPVLQKAIEWAARPVYEVPRVHRLINERVVWEGQPVRRQTALPRGGWP